jgi:hypothetical protein
MSDIKENLDKIKKEIPSRVTLIAVSKTKPPEIILDAYQQGHRIFGENKVQELTSKYDALPKDIEWHMIGHLQTNKVKYIAPFVKVIHSVDSLKLLNKINKEAAKNNRIIDCLFQLHIADEESKYGFEFEELKDIINTPDFESLNNIRAIGLMGMATFTDDRDKVREEFKNLNHYFTVLKEHYFKNNDAFAQLSMGMSDDYQIAIEEGSTMIRVGSSIFGARNYNV